MPLLNKKSQYKTTKKRDIYIILNPLSQEFFIGHCKETSKKNLYIKHYNEQKYQTKNSVETLKKNGNKPCMFVLEKVETTEVEAYKYVVVWTKIFIENGYINLAKGSIEEYINNLLEENEKLYNKRKNAPLDSILQCNNCLFQNYGKSDCKLRGKQ